MQHSYLLAGISSSKLIRLLARNGFSLRPKYLFRILFLLQASAFASIFNRVDKRKMDAALSNYNMPDDPVFIVGHWRTGTTLLHQLMALDENLATPNVFIVSAPLSFLVSEKYYKPVMTKAMQPTRPMDNVKLGFYQAQEDEYALIKLTLDSPLEKLLFPRGGKYFLLDEPGFRPKQSTKWKSAIQNFCLRLSYAHGKRVLLKNPFHSMRIPMLRSIYPNAKFIHIHRHPYEVVPSTIHMWNVVGEQNKLKHTMKSPAVEEVATVLNRMLNEIREQFGKMPEKSKIEIGFKELEDEPLQTVRQVYQGLGLPYTPEFEHRMKTMFSAMKSYRKNKYRLSENDKETIQNILKNQFIHYNYHG